MVGQVVASKHRSRAICKGGLAGALVLSVALSLTACSPSTERSSSGAERLSEREQAGPTGAQAQDGPRLALLFGVGRYSGEINELKNPKRDADLLGRELRATGFEAKVLRDPTRAEMRRALAEFSAELDRAGPNATGLVYFAGHGVQVNGVNYLLPRDAALPDGLSPALRTDVMEQLLDDAFVKAQDILSALGERPNGASVLVLDACRNNPIARSLARSVRSGSGVTRGLAEMRAPTGVLIAYATGPGDVSFDGDGDNSPYAEALAAEIRNPGQATDTFSRVRTRVREATGGKQIPLELYRLERPFCFAGCSAAAKSVAVATAETTSISRSIAAISGAWDFPEGNCTAPFTYSFNGDRLSITGPQWNASSRIVGEIDGWLKGEGQAPASIAGKSYFYRVDGDRLFYREANGAPIQLKACRS
jgi:uncharacterized caspase-like protein